MTLLRLFLPFLLLPFFFACSQQPGQGYARLGDTALYYKQAGKGETVMFLHPFGLDHRVWQSQFAALSSDHHVIVYDIRGFGRSVQGQEVPHNPVEDLVRLMDVLGVEKAHLAGLGLGANIAVRTAIDHPDRVLGLVLTSPNLDGFEDYSETFMDFYGRVVSLAATEGPGAAKTFWRQGPLFLLAQPDADKEALIDSMVAGYSGLHFQQVGLIQRSAPPAMLQLQRVQAPTLVITGQQDLADMIKVGEILGSGIPGAKREVVAGAAHFVNWDQEEAFDRLLTQFLSGK